MPAAASAPNSIQAGPSMSVRATRMASWTTPSSIGWIKPSERPPPGRASDAAMASRTMNPPEAIASSGGLASR
jgi:hypothetical protein